MNSTGFHNINYRHTAPATIREHSLCITQSTEREIADDLGDVFSIDICGALSISANRTYLKNTYNNAKLEMPFYPSKARTKAMCSKASESNLGFTSNFNFFQFYNK